MLQAHSSSGSAPLALAAPKAELQTQHGWQTADASRGRVSNTDWHLLGLDQAVQGAVPDTTPDKSSSPAPHVQLCQVIQVPLQALLKELDSRQQPPCTGEETPSGPGGSLGQHKAPGHAALGHKAPHHHPDQLAR